MLKVSQYCKGVICGKLCATMLIAAFASLALNSQSGAESDSGESYRFSVVKRSDLSALEVWAQDWCHGATVHDLATALGVNETKAAIAEYLSRGLTGDARKIVVEVCERELISDPPDLEGEVN